MAERPAAVIFDMDGVLFRWSKRQRLANLARLTGLPPERIHAALWASGFDDACDRGDYDADACLREVCTRLDVRLSVDEWIGARTATMRPRRSVWRLVAQVRQAVPVALLSNNSALLKRELPRHFPQAAALFGANLFFSSDFGLRKPDPEIFRRITARLGTMPSATAMVDDSKGYVAGAREAGLQAHHFTTAQALARFLGERGLI
jgi:glucose-1-phosphatase